MSSVLVYRIFQNYGFQMTRQYKVTKRFQENTLTKTADFQRIMSSEVTCRQIDVKERRSLTGKFQGRERKFLFNLFTFSLQFLSFKHSVVFRRVPNCGEMTRLSRQKSQPEMTCGKFSSNSHFSGSTKHRTTPFNLQLSHKIMLTQLSNKFASS